MDVVDQFIKTDTDNTPVKNTTVKVVNPQRPRFDPCIKTDGQSMSKPLENKSETRRCVIFNHFRFSVVQENNIVLGERKGTAKDVEAIESYFVEKGFNVDIYHDQPHDQIKQILNQYAVDKNDWRCFVCFILTHGSEDILYAQDESYNYNTLFAPFASAKCNGKAKLFFINASQGNQWDVGNEICTDACDIPLYVPKGDDFLVALSSVPEFTTMSHQERGSFFMQALIESLRNNESNDDILTVLTNVKKRIAAELSANYGNVLEYKGECVLRETRKQMPIFFSTLRQQVYV